MTTANNVENWNSALPTGNLTPSVMDDYARETRRCVENSTLWRTVATSATTYTVDAKDSSIIGNTGSGTVTVNLLSASGNKKNPLIIKRNGNNTVTLNPNGSETIEGSATYELSQDGESVIIIPDGTSDWKVIGTQFSESYKKVTTTPYTQLSSDRYIHVDVSSTSININLLANANATSGRTIKIKVSGGNSNTCTLVPNGSDTIEGAASYAMRYSGDWVDIVYDGINNWEIANQNPILGFQEKRVWDGASGDIPAGWALCNGTTVNSIVTDDLRDRFVVCAGTDYTQGSIGGEKEHILTEAEMPSHTHTYSRASSTASYLTPAVSAYKPPLAGSNTGSTGGDQAHNNTPEYYAVYWIQWVGLS